MKDYPKMGNGLLYSAGGYARIAFSSKKTIRRIETTTCGELISAYKTLLLPFVFSKYGKIRDLVEKNLGCSSSMMAID
jgi:hypothetical protein